MTAESSSSSPSSSFRAFTVHDAVWILGAKTRGFALGKTIPITGVTTDSRAVTPGDAFVALVGERFDGHEFVASALEQGASCAILSNPRALATAGDAHARSIARNAPVLLVNDTLVAYGELARWQRLRHDATVIALTGTNGKTTTKEMLARILDGVGPTLSTRANENNLIGVPKTLFGIRPDHAFAIVECGTNQPGEIARAAEIAAPDVAVLTNVGHGHLEGLGSFAGVIREKGALLSAVPAGGACVVNFDDLGSIQAARAAGTARADLVTYGLDGRCAFRATDVAGDENGIHFRLLDGTPVSLPVLGLHNVRNALAALATAWLLDVPLDFAAMRLASFTLPDLRLRRRVIGEGSPFAPITIIDDCYNANPSSMRAALATLQGCSLPAGVSGPVPRRVAVLGDMLELGEAAQDLHEQLGREAVRHGVDLCLSVGQFADGVADAVAAAGVDAYAINDAATAARVLEGEVAPGDLVLVKGSRAIGLEIVAREIEERFPEIEVRWHDQHPLAARVEDVDAGAPGATPAAG